MATVARAVEGGTMRQYVKIYCCCKLGAHEEGKPSDSFYQDCPLGLHEEVNDESE